MIYCDASAIVTYLLRRTHFDELQEYLVGFIGVELCTSTVGLIETVRTCDRFGDFPDLLARLTADYAEIDLTTTIRDRAAIIGGGLRTLDAIHLATADVLGDDLVAFVTYDRQLAAAARSIGLPVASPGAQRRRSSHDTP